MPMKRVAKARAAGRDVEAESGDPDDEEQDCRGNPAMTPAKL
jgi:hypothetical protein